MSRGGFLPVELSYAVFLRVLPKRGRAGPELTQEAPGLLFETKNRRRLRVASGGRRDIRW